MGVGAADFEDVGPAEPAQTVAGGVVGQPVPGAADRADHHDEAFAGIPGASTFNDGVLHQRTSSVIVG
ncbi:MAG: hypothetical protein ACRD1G_09150, partial [Acidimicrobiales bacterium]